MKEFKYYIGSGDYYGNGGPNEVFNNVYVPRLKQLGIKDKNMKEVATMFKDVYNIGYRDGGDNFNCALDD